MRAARAMESADQPTQDVEISKTPSDATLRRREKRYKAHVKLSNLPATAQDDLPSVLKLSRSQTEFLQTYVECPFLTDAEICRQIGITHTHLCSWKRKSEAFRRALAREHLRSQTVANMSRKVVLNGLLEAKDIAKDQRQPTAMISAWKEIGRMCGFYEPDRKEIVVSIDGHEALQKVKQMTREQLIEYLNAPPSREQLPALEGEFKELTPMEEEV